MIAIDAVLPDEQPRAASNQNRRNHRRVSNAIWQATCRNRQDDESETQRGDGVSEKPRQPHRVVPEEPSRAECDDNETECAEAFLAARATEECPPDDERDREHERDHHASSEAFDSGDEGFDTEPR